MKNKGITAPYFKFCSPESHSSSFHAITTLCINYMSHKRSIKDHIHIRVATFIREISRKAFHSKPQKKTASNLLCGESIKIVTFLIIAWWEITARGESGCIHSYSALF